MFFNFSYNWLESAVALLDGKIQPSKEYNPYDLYTALKKFIDKKVETIEIEDDEKKKNIQESIAAYKLKREKLLPASSYAKKTEKRNNSVIEVAYKKPIAVHTPVDPKMEAKRIEEFKQKLFAKRCPKTKKELSKTNVLRPRSKSLFMESITDSEGSETEPSSKSPDKTLRILRVLKNRGR